MHKIKYTNALGLDIGEKRIGVARVNSVALLPVPITTLQNDENLTKRLSEIIKQESIDLLVIGLPRNMSGEQTAQSQSIREFVSQKIEPNFNLQIVFQDETLSSVNAEKYSAETIKEKGIDAVAAAEILTYFNEVNK